MSRKLLLNGILATAGLIAVMAWAQGPGGPPGGFGPPPGFGPGNSERKLLKQFDENSDGWLNKQERAVAREFIKKNPNPGCLRMSFPSRTNDERRPKLIPKDNSCDDRFV